MKDLKASVFDIQGFSVHDGPGCRSVVFFKGCTMCCEWCSNPEGISSTNTLMYNQSKCVFDENCITACPENAISIFENRIQINNKKCISCIEPACVNECYSYALSLVGKTYTLSELFERIQRDRPFWGSNGGVTLSGGEPFLQSGFVAEFLKKCYNAYIHTAVETCGNVPWKNYADSIDYIDWIFFDLKHLDSKIHANATKVNNKLILRNAENLAKNSKARLIFRLVLIPGFNDSEEHLNQVVAFMKKVNRNEINILPLHHLGREKYVMLNKTYQAITYPVPIKSILERVKNYFENNSMHCYIGSVTPF
jgi:pyruvate formate lyase activating enzyme